ncbi:MAG TPA: HEPN domain-containing protein [Candidatus Lokiarchaeia archaeon]|nr:HEPN domain-containing protein [Candidatus Lokiarchaeia archaeon]
MSEFRFGAYDNWLKQATETIRSAEGDVANESYSWACFKAQQAAEYALKGMLYGLGLAASGHSVVKLAGIVASAVDTLTFKQSCLIYLDKLYIPTRYADVYDDGSPFSFYEEPDARRGLDCARIIIEIVTTYVSTLERRDDEEET